MGLFSKRRISVNLVDLVKSFHASISYYLLVFYYLLHVFSICLQKSASIQPRRSLSKFEGDSDRPSEIWNFGPSPKIRFKLSKLRFMRAARVRSRRVAAVVAEPRAGRRAGRSPISNILTPASRPAYEGN